MPRPFSFLQTPVTELGQASLALSLVRLPMADRMVSQAPAFDAGVLDVYINRLRKKIEVPALCRFIYNEAKVGYRFQAERSH